MSSRPSVATILVCVLALVLGACSSTPKKKRTVLMTEYDDARVGRQASQDVAKQMGVMDDPELNAYISRIGHKLLRGRVAVRGMGDFVADHAGQLVFVGGQRQ